MDVPRPTCRLHKDELGVRRDAESGNEVQPRCRKTARACILSCKCVPCALPEYGLCKNNVVFYESCSWLQIRCKVKSALVRVQVLLLL